MEFGALLLVLVVVWMLNRKKAPDSLQLLRSALECEDLAGAQRLAVEAPFVPPHLQTKLVRLAIRQGADPLSYQLTPEALVAVLERTPPSELPRIVRAAVLQQTPMLLGAYEALVKGFAATDPHQAGAYFDDMVAKGLLPSAATCARLLADVQEVELAERVLAQARARKVADVHVFRGASAAFRASGVYAKQMELYEQMQEDEVEPDCGLWTDLIVAACNCRDARMVELLERSGTRDPALFGRVLRRDLRALACADAAWVELDVQDLNYALGVLPERQRSQRFARMRASGRVDHGSFHAAAEKTVRGVPDWLEEMRGYGLLPTTATYQLLVQRACGLPVVWALVAAMAEDGVEPDAGVCVAVLDALPRGSGGGDVERAVALVQSCPEPGVLAAAVHALPDRYLGRLLAKLPTPADEEVACVVRSAQLASARLVHAHFPGPAATAAFADVCARAGVPDEAVAAAQEGGWPGDSAAVLVASLASRDVRAAMAVYEARPVSGQPRGELLEALARAGEMDAARTVLRDAVAAGETALRAFHAVVRGYCVAGDAARALALARTLREPALLPCVLEAAARKGDRATAEQAVEQLEAAGRVTSETLHALVRAYGKCGDTAAAERAVESLPLKHGFVPAPSVTAALVSACCANADMARAARWGDPADPQIVVGYLRARDRPGARAAIAAAEAAGARVDPDVRALVDRLA